jgi:hypothetical protein
VRDQTRLEIKQPFVERNIPLKSPERFEMIQVSHVVAEDRPAAIAQRKRTLELATDRKDRRSTFDWKRDRLRRVSPGPAHRRFHFADHPRHRIVAAHMNRAIVDEKQIANPPQDINGLGLLADNRLVSPVPAGHYERKPVHLPHE